MTMEQAWRRSDLFEGLSDEQAAALLALGDVAVFEPGAMICEADDPSTEMLIVRAGRVAVELVLPGRSEREVVATIGPGDVLGELSLVDGHRRSASARATSRVEATVLPREALVAHLERDVAVGYLVMRNLSRIVTSRLRETNLALREVVGQHQRIARALALLPG